MIFRICLIFCLTILFSALSNADIRVGYTSDLSKENKDYHNEVGRGLDTYLRYVNSLNGIRGQTINLIAIDNANDLNLFKQSLIRLAESDAKIIIVNPLPIYGSEHVIKQFLQSHKEVIFSKNLQYQERPANFVSYKVDYATEVKALIDFIKVSQNLTEAEIAIYTDDQDSSNECNATAIDYLTELGAWHDRIITFHKRDLKKIGPLLESLPNTKVKGILLCASPANIPGFISAAMPQLPHGAYFSLSNANTANFASKMPSAYNGFIASQTVPSCKANLAAAVEFKQLFRKAYPGYKLTPASFEGFILAKIIVAALQASNADYTTESFLNGLNSFDTVSIGLDMPLSFASTAPQQGIDRVWFSKIVDQEFIDPKI